MDNSILRSEQSISEENARFMSGVYRWMSIGLAVTFVTSYYVSITPFIYQVVIGNKIVFYGLIITQILAVFYLAAKIKNMSAVLATIIYLTYALLTGLTLSVIFFIYTQDSIQNAFLITSFSFAGLSAFGYFTKKDLGPIGTFCIMGLWGLIGFGLLSLFFPSMMSSTMNQVYSIAGILIFSGLTAYDTQKIKESNIIGNEGTDEDHKETIYGALTLYLDFINLFLKILSATGKKK